MRTSRFLALALGIFLVAEAQASPLKLWYDTTAGTPLTQGLMIGNGRMGGIVMGNPASDTIYLNDSSLWTGDANTSGNYSQPGFGAYQYLGTLALSLPGQTSYTNFRRELDIGDALATVTYTSGGVDYTRECFASNPDQVVVVRLTASAGGAYTGTLGYADSHSGTVTGSGNAITVAGALSNGIQYGARILVLNTGGSVATSSDGTVTFTGCYSLTIVIACGTNYVMDSAQNWQGPDPAAAIAAQAASAAAKSYETLKSAHLDDFHALFDRVVLDVGTTSATISALPTDQRIAYAAQGSDPDLEELLYQYGRYLLISCSRQGGLPANLQGLWNVSNSPPWLSDYHTNINIEMNYWGAEVSNLSECHLPLLNFIQSQIPLWRLRTGDLPSASKPNGTPRGWTVRTSHNITGGMGWNWNVSANAWYALHFWEHYAFTGDLAYLQNVAYPVLKEVCQYWQDDLKTTASGLVAPNGWSPEHGPFQDGTSYDQELVWNVFNNYIQASQILGVDADYRATVTQLRDQLYKPIVGTWGQLTEWMNASTESTYATNPELHRHTSHLVGLYPGSEITPDFDSTRAVAAQVSLVARGETGDSQSEWAAAWRTGLWARLRNGDMARHWLNLFFSWGCNPNLIGNLGGTPQWDGSFGFSGTIPEMLLQSHAGFLDLLPALPSGWGNGSVIGLKARGGYTVDLAWKFDGLTTARIVASETGTCQVRTGQAVDVTHDGVPVAVTHPASGLTAWSANAGDVFDIVNPTPNLPAAPTNVAAAAGDGAVVLSWTTVAGADGYRIQRATASGGPYTILVNFTPGVVFVDDSVSNGTPYFYIVSALEGDSAGTASSEVNVTPATSSTLVSRATGGIATASLQNPPSETATNAFDGSTSTKWYNGGSASTGWLAYQFADGAAWRITRYQLASANDVAQRDPKSWQLQGSNDGASWTTVDTQSSQTFSARKQTKTYNFTNTTPYRFYRLNITANSGGSSYGLQLSEFALFSSPSDPGDKTLPVLAPTADITAEADLANGARVSFAPSATDAVSGAATTVCVPASGSVFPIGTTTVVCTATDLAGNTSTDSFTVTVRSTFTSFQKQNFNAAQLADISISGPSADPDGDGIPNLLEYATGGSPWQPGAAATTQVGGTDDAPLMLTFQRLSPSPVTYKIEASSDLQTWTTITMLPKDTDTWSGSASVSESGSGSSRAVTVTDTAAPSTSARRFLRLSIAP